MELPPELEILASGDTVGLEEWADEHVDDQNILRCLRGYHASWRATAEYRGALVHIQRLLAQSATEQLKGQVQRDDCQFCGGSKGGTPGNENMVGGVAMCDYCHSLYMDAVQRDLEGL